MSNKQTQEYFKNHISNVKFSCPKEYLNKYNEEVLDQFIYITDSSDKRLVKIRDKSFQFCPYTEGYVILIRLTQKDFKESDRRTVNICFGNCAKTTSAAAKCYLNYYKTLYKKLKHHKDHFFVIIKCSSEGVLDFNEFYDYTSVVFD